MEITLKNPRIATVGNGMTLLHEIRLDQMQEKIYKALLGESIICEEIESK
jgi:hypothetical protein